MDLEGTKVTFYTTDFSVYVLELERDERTQSPNFYVGKSKRVQTRFEQHRAGTGSEWTKIHKPVALSEVIPGSEDENRIVAKYAAIYGIDHVRGGTFSQVNLSDAKKRMLQDLICDMTDRCFCCQGVGHFAKDCPVKYHQRQQHHQYPTQESCHRCGGRSHISRDCPAPKTCHVCHRDDHLARNCPRNHTQTHTEPRLGVTMCFLCRKRGHKAAQCRSVKSH